MIAAGHSDEARGAAAFIEWLATTDIESCHFPEQRLLVRIASRFPESRLKVAERARLNGIVRLLWTKSRLTLDHAAPVLKALRAAGVELLMLKGMALTALDMQNLKGRIAHDVDIVIRGADLPVALSILDDAGWRSARGESGLLLKQRGAAFRSLNFKKPPFGDIDLHTRAYLTTRRDSEAEIGLWSRSTRATLLGADVLVPSPTDRLVTAIAHGVVDAHRHSDWLVDCAHLVGEAGIDWSLVEALVDTLAIPAQATLVLLYLSDVLGFPVPEATLASLWAKARSNPGDYFKALFLGYPRSHHSLLSSAGRQIFKKQHSAQVKRANVNGSQAGGTSGIKLRTVRAPKAFPDAPPALRHRLAVEPGATRCSIVVGLEATGRARRYVFEVNTSDRHLAQLRFKDVFGRRRLFLGTEILLPSDVAPDDIWIEARQSGILPGLNPSEEQAAFGPRPFRILVR